MRFIFNKKRDQGFIRLFLSITAPLFSLSLMMLGFGFFLTFLTVRLSLEGYSTSIIGFTHSAYSFGFLIGAWRIEKSIKRVKHTRAFAIFASIATGLVMIMGIVFSPWAWIALRFLTGLCIASLYVVIESWLLIVAPKTKRSLILGFYMIVLYASQATSQFILNLVNPSTSLPFLVTGALSAFSIVPVTFTNTSVPELAHSSVKGIKEVFKTAPLGFIGCTLSGMVLSAFYGFTPKYAAALGIPIASMMSITIAGGFLLQWPIGVISDIFDRRKVLIAVSLATILPCLGIIFVTHSTLWALIFSFIFGGLAFTIYPLAITQVCDRFDPDHVTEVTGILLVAYSIGSVLGPIFTPLFFRMMGPPGIYTFAAIMAALLAGVGILGLRRNAPIRKEYQKDFVPLPRETPVAYELDPRSDGKEEENEEEGAENSPAE